MPLGKVLLIEISGTAAGSAEQDQTARMCKLILLCTLRKIIRGCDIRDKVYIGQFYYRLRSYQEVAVFLQLSKSCFKMRLCKLN